MFLRGKMGRMVLTGWGLRQREWRTTNQNQRTRFRSSGSTNSSSLSLPNSVWPKVNIWQWTTFGLGLVAGYRVWEETDANQSHRYAKKVISHLSKPFVSAHDRVDDIPELEFVKRDARRMGELNGNLRMSGGLTLLEGPSDCGKTTAVQHILVDTKRSAVYFSVRDNASGRSPLTAFAQVFGLQDLPVDKQSDALDIIRRALEQLREQAQQSHLAPPVLVIDDVQLLLEPSTFADGGRVILEWCLGRAAHQELTVLFISSERVEPKMKEVSGYAARLRVPGVFDYIDPEQLKASLRAVVGKLLFTEEEADRVVSVLGTHMSDIRRLQRRRNEAIDQPVACDAAVDDLVVEEARLLHQQLSPVTELSLPDRSRIRRAVETMVCDHLAGSDGDVSVFELLEVAHSKWKVTVGEFKSIVEGLVTKHLLRRYYRPRDHDEYLAFHRPLQRAAYRHLCESRASPTIAPRTNTWFSRWL